MGSLLGTIGSALTKATKTAAQTALDKAKKNTTTKTSTPTTTATKAATASAYTPLGTYNDHDMQEYNYSDYAKILAAQDAYTKASQAGDAAGMQAAHNQAEAIRTGYNYSGGADGSDMYSLKTPVAPITQQQGNLPELKLPELDLPDYDKFQYDDFEKPADFSYADFKYDPTTDEAYKAYVDQFTRQGQSASEQALANTSAATGGIPSSYAAAANAQMKQAYAKKTSDMIPTLQAAAQAQYNTNRNFDYGAYSDDKNFDYADYLNDRNLDYSEHQNDYNARSNNAKSEYDAGVNNANAYYNADWNNINYNDSRGDLAYDRNKDQEQFDYSKLVNEQNRNDTLTQQQVDNTYRDNTFDWTKQTDQRDYNYGASQDSIRNSLSSDDNSRAWSQFNYNKQQDELARTDQKEAEGKEYNQQLREKIAANKESETNQAVEFKIKDFVSQALQSGNAKQYLMQNQYGLTNEEYTQILDMLKGYQALDDPEE